MLKSWPLAIVAVLTITSGCASVSGPSEPHWEYVLAHGRELQTGMTDRQVLDLLGTPQTIVAVPRQWVYRPPGLGDRPALIVRFENRMLVTGWRWTSVSIEEVRHRGEQPLDHASIP